MPTKKTKTSKFNIDAEIINNFTKIRLFDNLINLIKNCNSDEALSILNNNDEHLSLCQLTIEGFTLLMYACMYKLEDVALFIINSGFSKLDHISNSTFNALIYAINNNLEKVSYALIIQPDSKLDYVDRFGNSALIYACKKGNENIALFLIKTNKDNCNILHKNNDGKNALMYAIQNEMNMTIMELYKIYYPPWIIYK